MYAKVFLVAAALAPAALAQATIEPYTFNCNRGQYGYGWSNGDNSNSGADRSFADIINHFANNSNLYNNCSLTARTANSGNIATIAQVSLGCRFFFMGSRPRVVSSGLTRILQSLFDQWEEAYCQTVALSNSLTQVRETDNEQHEICHAKAYVSSPPPPKPSPRAPMY